MIVFRHADPRYPFLRDDASQPEARWHGPGEGPANYFSDTPHGAWAELLRHEGIRTAADLATVRRALWAVEIDPPPEVPAISALTMRGGLPSYPACQAEARAMRGRGARGLRAPSAALLPGEARGTRVVAGKARRAAARDGLVYVLFGARDDVVGWQVVRRGRPGVGLLRRVRHL